MRILVLVALSGIVHAPQERQPAQAPPFDPVASVQRGCALLLEMQEGEGRREWPYEGVYRVREPGGDEDVIPIGYRVGGSAIACLALVAAPGYADEVGAERRAAVARALAFVLEALDLPLMAPTREDSYDVRGWGHIYALLLLVTLEQRGLTPPELAARAHEAIPRLVHALEEGALDEVGGWNYAGRNSPAPFMTGPALQALFAAEARGYAVSARVLDQALDALERGRAHSGSIAYSTPAAARATTEESALAFMDKLQGSAGRMLAVESTLTQAGRGDERRLAFAVESFFAHLDELEQRRKQSGTHVKPYGIAPYYVMYAYLAAAQAIELLSDVPARERWRAELRAQLALTAESEGGWNDRVFARSRNFGTAVGMLALLQPELAPPPRRTPSPLVAPAQR